MITTPRLPPSVTSLARTCMQYTRRERPIAATRVHPSPSLLCADAAWGIKLTQPNPSAAPSIKAVFHPQSISHRFALSLSLSLSLLVLHTSQYYALGLYMGLYLASHSSSDHPPTMMSMHTSPPLRSSSLEMPSPRHTCSWHATANRGFSAGCLPRLSSTARRRRPLRWLEDGASQGTASR